MNIVIERAANSDLEKLMRWREVVLREVFSIPAEDSISELLDKNREYYRTALKKGEHIACFAYMEEHTDEKRGSQAGEKCLFSCTEERADEKPVGCGGVCLYQEMPSPDNPTGRCAYLMNIYTIPAMRRQGIGEAVVRWLVQEAKHHGADKIYLEASPKAYPLYKKMGFCDMKGYLKL